MDKIINQLKKEGFINVRECPLPPNLDMEAHTHDEHTVHIILEGDLTIIDSEGVKKYSPGDRVEFKAGTTHKARGSIDNGRMIVGEKTAQVPTFPKEVAAPARRALASIGVRDVHDLVDFTEEEIEELHGMGPKAFTALKAELKKLKLNFKK